MATTVIKVQEVATIIDIKRFNIPLMNRHQYKVTLRSGKQIILETTEHNTYAIFENGNIRFNRPVKFLEDVK